MAEQPRFTTFSPPGKPHIVCHGEYEQGSQEWLQARCGMLTASEVKLILGVAGGGVMVQYQASSSVPDKITPKRQAALDAIGDRKGSVSDLCFLANVSDGVIRALIKDGALERIEVEQPRRFFAPNDDRERAHMWELLAQRVNQYVEPHFIGDDMLRGHEDEVRARLLYSEKYAPVTTDVAFMTNNVFGFCIGYSPDGIVGDDGLIECKSRRQKFQMQTIVEGGVPAEYMLQLQTALLVSERAWIDFVSYSGGMPMYVHRVEPDAEMQEAIVAAATSFEAKLNEKLAAYEEAASRFYPTERVIEQEMF